MKKEITVKELKAKMKSWLNNNPQIFIDYQENPPLRMIQRQISTDINSPINSSHLVSSLQCEFNGHGIGIGFCREVYQEWWKETEEDPEHEFWSTEHKDWLKEDK